MLGASLGVCNVRASLASSLAMPIVRPSRRMSAYARRGFGGGRLHGRVASRGVTLLELMTVMIVIAVLISFALGMIRSASQRAQIARARADLAALADALERYKAYYGDYPQTGNAAQATPVRTSATITQNQAQALLLNALIGVYGPTNFTNRQNGPLFIEASKFSLEVDITTTARASTFGMAQGTPPLKQPEANCFLDPWGQRYVYYYKPAPVGNTTPPNQWRAPGYLLYSIGPDGLQQAPSTATGLFTGTTQYTGNNADNIYATP